MELDAQVMRVPTCLPAPEVCNTLDKCLTRCESRLACDPTSNCVTLSSQLSLEKVILSPLLVVVGRLQSTPLQRLRLSYSVFVAQLNAL